ncbi:hypothetical protein [Jiangella muralis]|uniref:hypothetical protein n=1 Tax=Jiangella muralis TaxID=702383 RepID=UPI00069FCA15|nr:hypothetical protein [Jiangella muralis]
MTNAPATSGDDEGPRYVALSVRVSTDLRKRVRRAAIDHDVEIQDIVTQAIEDKLADLEAHGWSGKRGRR